MFTDPIADYLTRIRNGLRAGHRFVEVPASNLKKDMTKVLYDKGYVENYKFEDDGKQGIVKIALKYHSPNRTPVIKKLERASKPGLRKYSNSRELPRVMNGLGVAIMSTSNGVMTDKEARNTNVGGEVLCYVH